MNHPTPAGPDPVLILLAACWLALEAAAVLIVALIALALALLDRRPMATAPQRRPALPPAMPTPAALPPAPPLAALTVAQLRTRARAAGLPQLGRRGRRAELLAALALAVP